MAELSINYKDYHKRVIFPRGKQKDFLEKIQIQLNLSLRELANIARVHVRSMTDWKREKFSMSLPALKRLCGKGGISLPKNIEIKDPFWYTSNGSSAGGIAVYKKYGYVGGDPEYRKKKWYEWWEKEGKFRRHPIINICLPINIPQKSSEFAEFVGIILGDGSIALRQVVITLHKFDDRDFIEHVKNLFQKLFRLNPSVYERRGKSAVNIVVSRSELVQFLVRMGLKIGGKVRQQVRVPYWMEKSEKFTKSCLRGLFDTDGCFYVDKHHYKDKVYYNCAMNFTNRSLPILFFFKTKLEQLGFHPTHNTKFSISLRKEDEIIKYFQIISSSNPKHLNKFKEYFKNKYGEVPKFGHTGTVSKTDGRLKRHVGSNPTLSDRCPTLNGLKITNL